MHVLSESMSYLEENSEVELLMKIRQMQYQVVIFLTKIKSSLYWRYYAEACNEWWSPSPRLSVCATQLRRNVAAVASRWRDCVRCDRPGNRTPDLPHVWRCAEQLN